MSIPSTVLREIMKHFGGHPIIRDLSLELFEGEIFALLGRSGCGKTTILRILAGLETADAGKITFRTKTWLDVEAGVAIPPQKRNIGMVFQSYAIWPHMTVMQHVMYPLKRSSMDQSARRDRPRAVIRLVGLDEYEHASASQLSGGQQQRVAFARAIVTEPDLLLLDEPFSNLDVHLRQQMRIELAQLQRRLGITTLLVTHDQLDAFVLSDRIGLMRGGQLDQVGSARTIYEHPTTRNVREFVGRSIPIGSIVRNCSLEDCLIDFSNGSRLKVKIPSAKQPAVGEAVRLWVRPEDIQVRRATGAHEGIDGLTGRIMQIIFVGDRYHCLVELDPNETVWIYAPRSFQPIPFEPVLLVPEPGSVQVDEDPT